MIDFSNCKTTRKTYGGANGNKKGVVYDDRLYMLKFPSKSTKNKEISYTNSCFSEHIGSTVFNILGIPAQKTILGKYKTSTANEKIAVACEDIESNGYVLKDFASLKNSVIDSEQNGYGTEISDILQSIETQENIDPIKLKQHFYTMFVVDSFLGNFDRHNGNWGFLYNQNTDDFKIAPIYDCGSCLYPQADDNLIRKILTNQDELENRIYVFPTSAIKENGKKVSYYDFLMNADDIILLQSIVDVANRIYERSSDIKNFIDSIEGLDDLHKTFYEYMLENRFSMIIQPAFEKANSLLRELNISIHNDMKQ